MQHTEEAAAAHGSKPAATTPGVKSIPPWQLGELDPPPVHSWRDARKMIGPSLLMAGAAIGGGEWLMGPKVTAQYGGAVMWVATVSLIAQVIYNIEVSRYTLYSGEPIMLGKFRTLPGPLFWFFLYVVLDFGAIFPYLAANAATPALALVLGKLPDPEHIPAHKTMMQWMSYGILLLSMVPLLFGGKIYNALKAVMGFKVVVVLGFLSILAVLYSATSTWSSIGFGLIQFGTIPVEGGGLKNIFSELFAGNGVPQIDRNSLKDLSAFAAIAGVGGLAQMAVSNYTRDQGWGMGKHVGAIPSLIGGQNVELSHTGMVFPVNENSLKNWRGWYNHVVRDQLVIWLPACVIGLALPAMLSLQFLPRDVKVSDWTAAGMTADGVKNVVGGGLGVFYWYMILFCGFLVLVPATSSSADGFVRRWVDVSWSCLPQLRSLDPHKVRNVYFAFLAVYLVGGLTLLSLPGRPVRLLQVASLLMHLALGFSCWHTLYLNCALLPKEIRPGWFMRAGLAVSGLFFLGLFYLTLSQAKW